MRGEDPCQGNLPPRAIGSPPHARGGLRCGQFGAGPGRITPACAGRTPASTAPAKPSRDHPRMRGEDHSSSFDLLDLQRITPACAGRTSARRRSPTGVPDHPRMRGEDAAVATDVRSGEGSPPHARGGREPGVDLRLGCRITPACAGRTRSTRKFRARGTDHPRMRGEDRAGGTAGERRCGSPPHARGGPTLTIRPARRLRITPACAGRTPQGGKTPPGGTDHPRMRGEDARLARLSASRIGSPPHARGGPRSGPRRSSAARITPACAGRTLPVPRSPSSTPDHPRMRGEDTS